MLSNTKLTQTHNPGAPRGFCAALDNLANLCYNTHLVTKEREMAFNYSKYYATLFRKRGYTLINGVWYYDAAGKYPVYNTAS